LILTCFALGGGSLAFDRRTSQRFDTCHGLVGMGGSLSQVGTKDRDPATVLVPCGAGSGPAQPKESMMRFYTKQHQFYCGIDLHARLLAVCIVDQAGDVVCRTQIPDDKQLLLKTLAPYRPNVAVAVECLFAWYWVAALCAA